MMPTTSLEETQTKTELIRKLRHFLIHQGRLQGLAKRARRTRRTPADERAQLLAELHLEDDLAVIQSYVDRQRWWLTVAHVVYGDLRGRPHPVKDAADFRKFDRLLFDHV